MSAKLEMRGLDALRLALRRLPGDLAEEAEEIVLRHGNHAGRAIAQNYPQGPTGNLKARVTMERNRSKFGTRARVRSLAPHASIFEKGTKTRRTDKGYNRGDMPKAPDGARMIPTAIRFRQRMVAELIALVRRAGFEVNG